MTMSKPHDDPECRCGPCAAWLTKAYQTAFENLDRALADGILVTSDANGNAVFMLPGKLERISCTVTIGPVDSRGPVRLIANPEAEGIPAPPPRPVVLVKAPDPSPRPEPHPSTRRHRSSRSSPR